MSEDYTKEFKQLFLKCDINKDETQTLVRYLAGVDEMATHIVEFNPYITIDELISLAYKVELQVRVKEQEEIQRTLKKTHLLLLH